MFTPEQKAVLLRYFEEYGMTSTHRRNTDLMQRCAAEVGTTIERIKVCRGGVNSINLDLWTTPAPYGVRVHSPFLEQVMNQKLNDYVCNVMLAFHAELDRV